MFLQILSIGFISFLITYISIPVINKVGKKYLLIDKPNERKQHNKLIVRIGGLSILFGLLSPFVLFFIFGLINPESYQVILTILFGSIFMFLIGFIDDIFSISFSKRLILQLFVSSLIWNQGLKINEIYLSWLIPNLNNIEISPFLDLLITNIWVVGIINAINWLDGLDGLASGINLISALGFTFASLSIGIFNESFLTMALAGSCLGFLLYNSYPAKIFMGDGGSYLLGSLIAFYSLYLYRIDLSSGNTLIDPFSITLFILLPLIDMVYVIFTRISNGTLPFLPDRRHLHHRLMQLGFNHKDTVNFCYLISIFFTSVALGNIYPDLRFYFILLSLLLNAYFIKLHFKKFIFMLKNLFKIKN